MEREPIDFLARNLEPLLDASRATLAGLLGANADDRPQVPRAVHPSASILVLG